ncbi:hypothetical protein BDZ45DRAFT_741454 [Acephala macrosclerotiorum]|nr:hypothetical protein BDZ45DRAFT_741454 [Acephala macrosclerotiorum]
MVDLGKLNDILKRPECDFCSLVALASQQTWAGSWDEVARSGTTCYINALEPERQQPKGYALQITETASNWQWLEFDLVFKGHDSDSESFARAFELCPKVDKEFLKTSINTCEATHKRCVLDAQPATPDRMSVIDLDMMSIGPAPKNCRYLALSYVWGKITEQWLTLTRENVESLSQKNALVQARLPQTKQQIDIMDSIYASATLTIVAGAGDHANSGLPGVSKWSREVKRQTITIQDIEISNVLPRLGETAERSIWNTRGWTYQERMFSRRCIFLTEAQAFFACGHFASFPRNHELDVSEQQGQVEKRIANASLPSWSWASTNGAVKYSFTEKRITDSSSLPAFWQDGEEPEQFLIDWFLNVDGSQILRIKERPPSPIWPLISPDQGSTDLIKITLQGPGRLLFQTQRAFLSLTNSVPFRTIDSWWTDYTQDINLSTVSIASILLDGSPDGPIGFIELDKIWAEQHLSQEARQLQWEFLAISLAATDRNDYMHRHFTMRRNINYPIVLSRNVREIIVNVMLVERNGDVARRLGVGKIYLDCWELSDPQKTWVVLE